MSRLWARFLGSLANVLIKQQLFFVEPRPRVQIWTADCPDNCPSSSKHLLSQIFSVWAWDSKPKSFTICFYEPEMNYRNEDFMLLFPILLFCSSIYNCCKNCNKAYFLLFKVISYYFISFEFFF